MKKPSGIQIVGAIIGIAVFVVGIIMACYYGGLFA